MSLPDPTILGRGAAHAAVDKTLAAHRRFLYLCGCLLVLIYAVIEFPFGSPAIVYLWWLCFFVAVRYRQLEALAH